MRSLGCDGGIQWEIYYLQENERAEVESQRAEIIEQENARLREQLRGLRVAIH